MQNARLDETQAGVKIAWRNINNLKYADDTTFMSESEEELKSVLMKAKEETLDSVGEGEGGMFRENSIETCILSMVKQITSSGWMHETRAWAWCTGKTQRDRVEMEVGGGIGMGNTCKSMAYSCQCMTKTTTIL